MESNKFYYYSRGSLSELLDHLIEIKDNGFIEEEVYSEIRSLILESIKVLNGFIYYLKKENLKNKSS
ncbi:four helix bundle protein [Algoriphagus halophilus]|uniref:four helix bundle protein n=1 Tax=Algoriphagus halophilus TaxID=226505 RepID=UPI00358DEB3C